ncbi:MAG TPA: hypothetical protein VKT82_15550 [Ktedonobacterales bacterium]|nr:hypothetical protein [Ktedonobacterales bacterium]
MALKYTIFTPEHASLAVEEYGGGNGGYAFEWRGSGLTFCTHLIVSLLDIRWAERAGGFMDHFTEHQTYHMIWHHGKRWNGATDPARANAVLRWLGGLEAETLMPVLLDTFCPDRAQARMEGLPLPGYDHPGTERWYWHMVWLRTSCLALDCQAVLITTQAMPMEESYRRAKDRTFVARECRAMAKTALQLREGRQVQK